MGSDSNRSGMLYSLQIGRAFAAIAVVLHHVAGAARILFPGLDGLGLNILGLGYLGVDYFFVLSGFIIAYSTLGGTQDAQGARHYVRSRIIRIFVPYLPVSLGLLAACVVIPALCANNDHSLLASVTLLPSDKLPVLSVAWSLQHEIVFYALFGLCFFVFKDARLIFLWCIPFAVVPFFELPRWTNVMAAFFNLEFLFGVGAYYLYRAGRFYAVRHALLFAGIFIVMIGGAVLLQGAIPHYYRVITGVGFTMIVLALVHMERNIDFSRFRTLIFLGAASYAIYLVHAPFLSVVLKINPVLSHWTSVFVLMVLATYAAGILYHVIVERPAIAFIKKRLG